MKNISRKKVMGGRSSQEPIVKCEPRGGNGKSICYRDVHLSSFGRKDT